MRGVSLEGMTRFILHKLESFPPLPPVNPMVVAPMLLASSMAATTFLLLPEVVMPITTSSGRHNASI